jgi:putative N6-adenine-specific DNA methylase
MINIKDKITLTATTCFGLEKTVQNELKSHGLSDFATTNGRVDVKAEIADIPKLNIWMRSADRIFWNLAEFPAHTFEDLFQGIAQIDWKEMFPSDAKIIVNAKSIRSTLGSLRAIQSISKKSIVKSMLDGKEDGVLPETGKDFSLTVSIIDNNVSVLMDTSGTGLNRRGYRLDPVEAPLRETLAAGLVLLSFYQADRLLVDPMCGSGTLPIEAAMIANNIAPGLKRDFASENWSFLPEKLWKETREHAKRQQKNDKLEIFGYDEDHLAIRACRKNADRAGVSDYITFKEQSLDKLWVDQEFGIVITNPPYARRIGNFTDINKTYVTFNKIFKKKDGWSVYVITADEKFPDYFKRERPSRKRKLYNGKIQVNYYQYYGRRPS